MTQLAEIDRAASSREQNAEQYLTFMLDDEEYGVDILKVQEIKGWTPPTPVPNVPDHVLGVTNMRGTIVPIVDLRRRFALSPASPQATTVVIVLNISGDQGNRCVGFVVDAVSDVFSVDSEQIAPSPEGANSRYVMGLATIDERMLVLLNTVLLVEETLAVATAGDPPVADEVTPEPQDEP